MYGDNRGILTVFSKSWLGNGSEKMTNALDNKYTELNNNCRNP